MSGRVTARWTAAFAYEDLADVDASHAPEWWTLASPENHGADIAAWPDFEDFG